MLGLLEFVDHDDCKIRHVKALRHRIRQYLFSTQMKLLVHSCYQAVLYGSAAEGYSFAKQLSNVDVTNGALSRRKDL